MSNPKSQNPLEILGQDEKYKPGNKNNKKRVHYVISRPLNNLLEKKSN